ncbi:DUF2905 domain-containing protein [bacterium]|nr:DUF2905 domain-containing protein [Chloroflexi bacterium CFX6]RIL12290.1 MAG: DUF2905 domain-containing protein [bacterium]
MGRWLIIAGLGIAAAGVYLRLGGRLPPLFHLPGDLVITRGPGTLYIPITTMVVVSLVLTALLRLFGAGGSR